MKEDILTKIPEMDYTEPAIETNAEEFDKVIRSRRSVRVYKDEPVADGVIEKGIEHALLAPNSSNLQPWRFIWVKNPEQKKKLVKACLGQSAARTAPELVIAVARTKAWPKVQKDMIGVLKENNAPKGAFAYYEKIVPLAYGQGPLGLIGLLKKNRDLF